ncbi:MAG: nicotinate-nucleotide--dimethylbenzimidazole phosphoribosyltransferase [Pseudomonadota bacterium]
MTLSWLTQSAATIDQEAMSQASARQAQLTKPPGSLGRLEEFAIRLAGMQGNPRPTLERVHITVFAADHGIAAEGVSAFPQAVTAEMVRNFARGGAAISVLARTLGAPLEVVNCGTVTAIEDLPSVIDARIADGTANFSQHPAMTVEQCERALALGKAAVERAVANRAQLFIAGEMGIANSSAATALACTLLSLPAGRLAGPGTGLDEAGIQHKIAVIDRALAWHDAGIRTPLDALCHVGGFEIAAMVGVYIACAQAGLPALVDGFIAGAAALAAVRIKPEIQPWLFYAHASKEPGHRHILHALDAHPLLDMEMRLGEGSGAAAAVPILRLACALHNGMATFDEAAVTGRI